MLQLTNMLLRMFLTLLVGICGGQLALRAKIPGGGIIGSMLAVILFSITTDLAYFPWQARIITQAVAGAFIAAPMTLDKIKAMRFVIKPAVMVVSSMLVMSIGIAWLCFTLSPMDPTTAFFASAPGGLTEIVLISIDTEADPLQISLIHSVRILFSLLFLSIVSKFVAAWIKRKYPALCVSRYKKNDTPNTVQQELPRGKFNLFVTLIVALSGALLGYFTGIPAGALIFSMIFICFFSITTKRAYIPLKLRFFTQACAGAIIGSSITMANVMAISTVFIPLIIILTGIIIMNLSIGIAVFLLCKLDINTALFSTIPAGIVEMALIADELDGDGAKVALIQLFRLISSIVIFPQVYLWIIRNFL